MAKKRNLKRQLYTFSKTDDGYAIVAPKHKGLVLSGGGAKGIAYVGMIKAMTETGFLKDLTHISGASAGSITASIMAMGMKPEHAEKLVIGLDVINLLDNKGFRLRAKGERFRSILEIVYMYQFKEHLNAVQLPVPKELQLDYAILKQKVVLYESALSRQGITINSVDDILELSHSVERLTNMDRAFQSIPTIIKNRDGEQLENPRFSFHDMARLRSLLPEDQQHLIKKLSVVTTNQTKRELEIHNEEYGANGSIAEKVQHSSAHPFIFTPAVNDAGEHIADGGILDNLPIIALKKLGLHKEEILCVKLESHSSFADRIANAASHIPEAITSFTRWVDDGMEHLIGGRLFTARASTRNREKIFHNLGNMLYLNTGSIDTTTMYPTLQEKQDVIDASYRSTRKLLGSHSRIFDNPLIAMVYLGKDKLDHTLIHETDEEELFQYAAYAKMIFLLQNQLAKEIKDNDFYSVENYLLQIDDILRKDSGLNETQQDQIMSLCLKQIDFYTEGQLEQHIMQKIAKEQDAHKVSWFTWLLKLLWKPIEWVLSFISSPKPEQTAEENVQESEDPIAPVRLYGLFAQTIHSTRLVKDDLSFDEDSASNDCCSILS
ncbi:patatin-like phospholipase family protein [Legionella shakespearei]|uniref:VipD n=1 Tax=Legionella shakespearei DSM 23087 TaxID=1122169 RepID=A0A0W0Z7V9_9GAMM|nr:patatin-like phospholipase family protein [Legionella shakespearei]KTD64963.1 VipD [Legionella shakespearei DSM 23087]